MLTSTHLGYGIAFVAGMATFFATCLLPVLPVYLGYIGGLSLPQSPMTAATRWRVMAHSLVFIAGFLLVFSILGFTASGVGRFIIQYRGVLQRIGGVMLILFGLGMLVPVPLPFVSRTYRLFSPSTSRRGSFVGAFLFGLTFGFAWTPCIGPILASILFLVSFGDSVWYGATLLGVFALGLGVPFVVAAFFFDVLYKRLSKIERLTRILQPILGASIVFVGILLMTDMLVILSQWSLSWGGALLL